MLRLTEDFECDRDFHGWNLYQAVDGKDKYGAPKRRRLTTYYANLHQVLKTVVDKSVGGCTTVDELRASLSDLQARLLKAIQESK